MMSIADQFTGQYPNPGAFVAALLSQIEIGMRLAGWKGAELVEARWTAPEPDWTDPTAPAAVIVVAPGTGAVTVDAVRDAMRRHNEARATRKQGEAA